MANALHAGRYAQNSGDSEKEDKKRKMLSSGTAASCALDTYAATSVQPTQ
jgi:hypothetical protein